MSNDTDPARRIPFPGLSEVFRHDLPASIVVFLVALPLSIGVAVATGAPVAAGLIAAVIGGLVAGLCGGSTLQVSGPTASLTVVVAESIHQFGWAVTCFITAGAGVLQILFGLSRIGRGALAIAPVVVHAMLAGIGIVITLQQVHVLLGGQSLSSSWDSIVQLPHQLVSVHPGDALVGVLVIAILLGWRYLPTAIRRVPAPLVAVVAATAVAQVVPTSIARISLRGPLFQDISLPALPSGGWGAVALTMITIALIASVETLLSAVAVTRLRPGTRCDLDRELLGQGVANMTSGLLGGLPVAAVIVRSITNVNAGARTRVSTMLSGVWVLIFAVAFVDVVQQIPKAALAGLLIVIGMGLVKLAHIRLARRSGDLIVYAVTVLVVVFWNLLLGMLTGLVLAFALLLWRVVRVVVAAEPVGGADRWLVTIDGTCTFLAVPRLTGELARVPAGVPVTVELTVDFLDHAASDSLHEWAKDHEKTGGTVEFVEMGAARIADLASGPPARGHARRLLTETLGPWRRTPLVDPIAAGITAYHRGHAHVMRPHLGALHDVQNPDSLFVTCSDSRLVPNVFTSSGPGDLFTVRNIGNLIPEGGQDSSVEAAIVYALDKLEVRSVVVCGHSGCGAMDALYHERVTGSGLDDWLAHGRGTLEQFRLGHPVAAAAAAAGFGEVDRLGMVNVAVQLETLARHERIARAVAERGLVLSGLFFDIRTARVLEITADGIAEFTDAADGFEVDMREPVVAQ
ncbi:bifunctional SulP family inorganic anion transporter/carbonic anhydrase [Nocardia sp. CA2R105]|uniref:SulP family inorganic anion transporter n=1 Tax=Nocardia coffeae TaxID=2873381 RepID=UPI001CA71871|nr:bifunctional SulP family inorganic anion transporter/carbonic anhydrase [Nocardia coffeae]MBY8859469.1 bifunctional SulP family inorganic anion transporter/carbonic anhydrase [Nocardia coffeae]